MKRFGVKNCGIYIFLLLSSCSEKGFYPTSSAVVISTVYGKQIIVNENTFVDTLDVSDTFVEITSNATIEYKMFKDGIEIMNPIILDEGINSLLVIVDNKTEFRITLYKPRRLSNASTISNLNLSVGDLTPEFNSNIFNYTLSLSNDEKELSLQTEADSSGTIQFLYNNVEVSNTFHVKGDESELQLKVLAEDGVAFNIYYIRIFRNPWKFIGNGPFEPRDGAGIVAFNNKLWLLGGWNPNVTDSEIWVSENGHDWQFVADGPWAGRHGAGAVVFRNKMWILSGDGFTDVWSSSDGANWTKVLDVAPWGRRYAPYVLVHDNKIWLMGGETFYETPTHGFNDVWSSEDGIHWTLVTEEAPWDPRGLIHGNVVLDNKIWIISGGLKGLPGEVAYSDVWNSTDGKYWNKITDAVPWVGRYHFSVATYNNKIWITDGSLGIQSNLSNEVWSTWDGINWKKMQKIPWAPTHGTSIIAFKKSLFMIGGYLRNEIWEMNLE